MRELIQNVTVPLTVDLLAPTGLPRETYLSALVESVRLFDPGSWTGTEVQAVHVGAIRTMPARLATCRVGGHEFYPGSGHLHAPLICPGHAEEQLMSEEQAHHRPLFAAIEHVSALRPELLSNGRGAVLVHIPIEGAPTPASGDRRLQAPCYQGRVTAYCGDGRLQGELGFYPTPGYLLRAECLPVVNAQGHRALHPHEWAARIAEHFHDLINR